ncbi:PAS domain-containing sensor histidine kinase [Azohydromonas australica]|uniref:PAS domain-containing sensor histidine kinase n=1 Tax=Azohydromonas australica TaxID=364039 RepID=UPI0004174F11|nr:PAS domain S-box protein [Azohydromonas australica]
MDYALPRRGLEQLLIDEAPQALIVTSPEGEVWLWNRMAQQTFGYTAQEALGRPLVELLVPADRAEEHAALQQRALLDGEAQARAAMCRHQDGRLLYVDLFKRMVREDGADGNGELRCFIDSYRDVTAQKVARDAQWIGQRYRNLLESVPDAIVIVNDSGRIVLFNSQAERLFGRPRDQVLGSSIEALLPTRYRHAHIGHRTRYHGTPQMRSMGAGLELYGLRGDGNGGGEEFPVEISLSPLDTEEGRFVMSAIRDITERKRFERELQEKNAALLVANQAKDRFLATMSHELRTPLNAIIGFTGILLMRLSGELTSEQERQLGIVKSSAEHLLSLINDLLDVARIQAGMVQLSPEPVDVAALLREVHASLMPLAQAKSLAFELDMPEGAPVLEVDRRALRQILINLSNNAIKFTEHGAVRLELRREGRETLVKVCDTGVGISEADQKKLFGAFTQVGDPRRRPEGTGMGLHLSARLAELLGARIEVESHVGEGSCFSLRFGAQAKAPA